MARSHRLIASCRLARTNGLGGQIRPRMDGCDDAMTRFATCPLRLPRLRYLKLIESSYLDRAELSGLLARLGTLTVVDLRIRSEVVERPGQNGDNRRPCLSAVL